MSAVPAAPHGEEIAAKADALLAAGYAQQAAGLLGQRLAEEPGDAVAWGHLARCRLDLEDGPGAVEAASQLVRLRPELGWGYRLLTSALLRERRLSEALTAAREAVRADPESWTTHWTLSEALRRLPGDRSEEGIRRQLDEAAEAVREALRLAPDEPKVYRQISLIQHMRGHRREAAQALTEVLRLDPADAGARADLVRLQEELGDARLTDVISAGSGLLAGAPDDEVARHNLDVGYHRLLRRARWIALLCLVVAAVAARAFPTGDDPRELPVERGTRLYGLAWIAGIWAVSLLIAWRRLPRGAWRGMRALCARSWLARSAPLSAAWCVLCAVAVVAVGWTDRAVVQTLVHAGWAVNLVVMYADHARRKVLLERGRYDLYG
ncbi:tetratricopeptide repeat protein [Streptomyces cacaoi]|uniref:tetratricopeptide repeat protein n=1 Tax=Streptomyces cacaoi TaxID=1898 RepID=UPI0011F224A3|nr:tetratricopeptide repeat protein [Streptomyces cacaoi]